MRGVLAIGVYLRAFEQRFGGNAPPIEADSAQLRSLDHGDAFSELRGAYGGDIAARAASYDYNVVFHISNVCQDI